MCETINEILHGDNKKLLRLKIILWKIIPTKKQLEISYTERHVADFVFSVENEW